MTIIGIDPGVKGGIAVIEDGDVWCFPMPDTCREIIILLKRIADFSGATAIIEQVHPMPGEGVTSAGTFMRNVGRLEMACAALDIRVEWVPPQRWQKPLSLSRPEVGPRPKPADLEPEEMFAGRLKAWRSAKASAKRDRKNQLKQLAQERFPAIKVTLATADALLIADWGRRSVSGVEAAARISAGGTP